MAFAQSPRQIDELAKKAMRRYRMPGMAVVVVKELGKPDRVTERTLFQTASNTKFFAAADLALSGRFRSHPNDGELRQVWPCSATADALPTADTLVATD